MNLHEGQNSSNNDSEEQNQETIHAAIAACFRESQEQNPIPLKMIQRHEIRKDLVAWGFNNPDQPQSLEGVIKELHTTRASLSQGCKESLGIGPMEVLRNIRLEHVHQALKDPEIRQRLNVKRVEDIRKHYGFQSRGNFAAIYADYFGEKPYATMKRASKTSIPNRTKETKSNQATNDSPKVCPEALTIQSSNNLANSALS